MCQWVTAEDAPDMAQLLDAKMQSMEQIIEEEQAHRAQMAALLQMQLKAMERVEEQERELGEAQCSDGRASGCSKIFA